MRSLDRLRESSENVQVLSLNVQAAMLRKERAQTQFEVMVRHLFDRMLNNEAFGEEAATRMTQLAYAIALPGVLVALFLFAAYHHPPPLHLARSFWSQACDHLFYVTYAFVILGTAIVFQWEMLFPDLIDVYVLTSLPIPRGRLLLGRITALAIFLALVQVETSGLGTLFLPAVADLKLSFWRHLTAHAAGVTLAAVFATTFFIALQSLLVCLPARIATKASSLVRTLSIVTLLTVLFLFPLVAHSIEEVLAMHSPLVGWYPPFWFLGVYQTVLYKAAAPPVFHQLARTGLIVTAVLAASGALLYPIAYTRRVRQLVEGTGTQQGRLAMGAVFRSGLHAVVVRTPRGRAIFHFAAQTLLRLQRLHLYMAMYAGVGIALVLSGLVVFLAEGTTIRIAIVPDGVRIAIPILAFWAVMGLRTALLSPLGLRGSWIFRVIVGSPGQQELQATELLAGLIAIAVTLALALVLHRLAPAELRTPLITLGQLVLAIGLCILLTDLAFLRVRSIPFTTVRKRSTRELPLTLVQYFVVFPAFALWVVSQETWIEANGGHLIKTVLALAALHVGLRWVRKWVVGSEEPMEEPMFAGLGLRED